MDLKTIRTIFRGVYISSLILLVWKLINGGNGDVFVWLLIVLWLIGMVEMKLKAIMSDKD